MHSLVITTCLPGLFWMLSGSPNLLNAAVLYDTIKPDCLRTTRHDLNLYTCVFVECIFPNRILFRYQGMQIYINSCSYFAFVLLLEVFLIFFIYYVWSNKDSSHHVSPWWDEPSEPNMALHPWFGGPGLFCHVLELYLALTGCFTRQSIVWPIQ